MKYYISYMDRQEISPAVHEKLLNLERPKRRPVRPWVRYGALAACAALIIGVGARQLAPGRAPAEDWQSAAQFVPDYESRPDAAGPEDPDPAAAAKDPSATEYDALPQIEYSLRTERGWESKISMDYAAPEGSTSRELTRDDVVALAGGEEALNTELNWGGFEFTGTAVFDRDGKVWQMNLAGKRDDFFFELGLAPDALPLACVVMEPRCVTEVWGVEVTGRHSGVYGEGPNREVWMPESREVEFVANGVGCRFTLYGLEGQGAAVEEMVARFVRQAILEGIYLQNVI